MRLPQPAARGIPDDGGSMQRLRQATFGVITMLASFAAAPPGDEMLVTKKVAAYFQDDQTFTELAPVAADKAEDVRALPLVVTGKKAVTFEGKAYSVEKEGLYRFIKLPNEVINLISRKDDNAMIPLLRGLSALHIHGNKDERIDDAMGKLKSMWTISRTCGPMRDLAYTVLRKQAGFWPRSVITVTNDTLSGFDDGHQMMEVYYPLQKKWILVDIDMGYLFQEKGKETYLDALQFWNIVRNKKPYELVKLSTKEIDPAFSIAMYARVQFSSEAGVKAWYARVYQIIGIDGKAFAWDEPSKKRLVEMWGKESLEDRSAWEKRVYKKVE
jgi:hypothetical protein